MKKVRAGFSVLVFAFLCFSCAFSPSVYKDSDGLVEQGDFNSALSALIEKEKTYGKKNQVLFYLDTGLLSHFSGEYEDSTERLSLAESKILENNTISISESVMSAVVNDNSATYGGEDFEDIYINIFKALNFYHLGNLESGMVEVRKIDNKIRLLTTKYEGIIQETKKEFDELDSSIKDSIGQGGQKLFSYNFSNSALARYISMLYYRHLGQMDDVRIDLQAVDKAFSSHGYSYHMPFYFPSISEYSSLVENAGLEVRTALLFDRPTLLKGPDGLGDWIRMFVKTPFEGIPETEKDMIITDAVSSMRNELFSDGNWYADYVRIRMRVVKTR